MKLAETKGRRDFFKGLLKEGAKTHGRLSRMGFSEARAKQERDSFFESYESSYALSLAYPDEILIESARQAGIEVEGKDRLEIVKELFARDEAV